MPPPAPELPMHILENRLNSFLPITKPRLKAKPAFPHSPSTHPNLTPKRLAQAGFYHNPEKGTTGVDADTCKCFLCGLSLGGWDEGDDPFEEHANRGGCSWGEVVCRAHVDRKKGVTQKYTSEAELPTSAESGKLREQTYKDWWPHPAKAGWKPTVKNLAKAGLVFTPSVEAPDAVQCVFCEYSIEGWEAKDDPTTLHQKKYPNCHFFVAQLDEPETSKVSSKALKSTASRSKRTTTAVSSVPDIIEIDDDDFDAPAPQQQSQSQSTNAKPPRIRKPRGTTATTSTSTTTDQPKRKTARKKATESNEEAESQVEIQGQAAGEVESVTLPDEDARSKSKSKSSRKTAGRKTKIVAEEEVGPSMQTREPRPVEETKDMTPRPTKSSRRVTKAATSIPQRPLTQLDGFANIPPSSPIHAPSKPSVRAAVNPLPTITTKPPSPSPPLPAEPGESGAQVVMDDIVKRAFTEEEKKMTLEELIRFEYRQRYDALKLEGEEMIQRWEERAEESRKLLEAL